MAGTIVKKCNCESQFQDTFYGKNMRLHNVDDNGTKASCTVCEGSAKYAKRKDGKTRPYKTV